MCKNTNCVYSIKSFHTQETVIYCTFYAVGAEKAPAGCDIPNIIDEIDDVITLTDEV